MDKDTFQQEVYNVVAAIPPGRVVTYGQIAYLVGRPQCSRMVGHAMRCARRHVFALPSGSEQPGQAGTVLGGTAGFAGGRGRDVQKEWVCGHEKMPVGIHERANTIRL